MVFPVIFPIASMVHICSVFMGKQKAIEFWGPSATLTAKVLGSIFMVPRINSPLKFDTFTSRMKTRIWLMKPLYDISIAYEDKDKIVLNYVNCPLCETFSALGVKEIGPHVCQSDWEIAKENADNWDFERNHQIGTGDEYCDHTYKRKQPVNPST